MRVRRQLIGVALLVWIGAAHADGNAVFAECHEAEKFFAGDADRKVEVATGRCTGFISGVLGTVKTYALEVPAPMRTCPPDDLPADQAVKLLMAWLRAHPEGIPSPSASVVLAAFHASYPCGRPSSK